MEEDINILEEFLKNMKKDNTYSSKGFYKHLENLIKGYRELEKRIISLTNLLCINDSDKNSIPKSKIKEIRDKAEVMDYYTLNNVIDDLTKLLGDE